MVTAAMAEAQVVMAEAQVVTAATAEAQVGTVPTPPRDMNQGTTQSRSSLIITGPIVSGRTDRVANPLCRGRPTLMGIQVPRSSPLPRRRSRASQPDCPAHRRAMCSLSSIHTTRRDPVWLVAGSNYLCRGYTHDRRTRHHNSSPSFGPSAPSD